MKLPINWLQDYIQVPKDPKVLIDKMTAIGHMQDGPPKQVSGDTVYDLEIRQNRSDCYSIIGLAREAAAVLDQKVNIPEAYTKEVPSAPAKLNIEIENADLCFRFQTVTIENVKIGPSPEWLTNKLEAYGVKSINNIVDITNFVMIEIGEPMHAYDIRHITEKIQIRTARPGEKLVILGGKELELTEQDLVIADSHKVVALAGVIGGEAPSVKSDTTTIVLEDATYDQASIRRSSIRHQVRTEASTRHEKFLHPKLTTLALRRAVQLIQELAGGQVTSHTDNYPVPFEQISIDLHLSHLNSLGGVQLTLDQAETTLTQLEIPTTTRDENTTQITVPYWRTDIVQEADIIEEVLRIYGYETIPATLPHTPPPMDLQGKSTYDIEEKIKDIMIAAGYDEEITEPLTKENYPVLQPITLENSLNADKTMLRTTLKNSLVAAFANQKKYRKSDIRIFEVGKIYFKVESRYNEEKVIGGVSVQPYEEVKGTIEVLFERLGYEYNDQIPTIELLPQENAVYFEVKLADILNQNRIVSTTNLFTSPPQVILQDLSLVMPEHTKVGDIMKAIQKTSPLIFSVKLGERPQLLKTGGKSLFLKITFFSPNTPITNEDVEKVRTTILQLLDREYQITLR